MPNNQPKAKRTNKGLNAYGKYSGLAFQMLAIILLGTWGGHLADTWLLLGFPVFTVLGVIFSVILAMYFSVKDLLKK